MWSRIAISVALWLAIFLAGLPSIAVAQGCEDVNGDGHFELDDIETLADYLRGKDVYLNPQSELLDCNEGWTIADLYGLIDGVWCNLAGCCWLSPWEYSYRTVGDTIFFPQARDVPDTIAQILLPIYLRFDQEAHPISWCQPSTIIPVDSRSTESNDCFALDTSHYRWTAHTVIIVEPHYPHYYYDNDPGILTSMKFVRANPGIGQVIPKILDSVADRQLGVATIDEEWEYDVFTPTVVTYDASVCCWGEVGNVDCDTSQTVDIGDVTELIRLLFITLHDPCCVDAANVDSDPGLVIDVGDLTKLIGHLFISQSELKGCNWARLPR